MLRSPVPNFEESISSPIPEDLQPSFPDQVAESGVRDKLRELLGLDDIPVEVEFTAKNVTESGGVRTTHLTYQNSLGESVPGILMMPLDGSTTDRAGIVCLPGTSGCAERLADPHFHLSPEGPLIGWARELVRRGYATVAITPKGTETRRGSIKQWATEMKLLAPYGRTQMGVLVEEALRAARILGSIQGVDSGRIGLTGMSLGGNATWYAMACAPWIAAGVPICGGVGSLAEVIHHGDRERHSGYFYVPHMLRYFDHARVVATCMPPRPFMIVAPSEDEDMPREGVDELLRIVSQAYTAAGHPERFKVHQPEGNHRFRMEYFEWMVEWFTFFLI